MATGQTGGPGLHVPKPVVKASESGLDPVPIPLHDTAEMAVTGRTTKLNIVWTELVS